MQLLILLAIVHGFSSLVCADDQPVDAAPLKLTMSLMLGITLVAFAWWISQLRRVPVPAFERLVRRGEHWHAGAFLFVTVVTFSVLDAAQIIRGNLRLSSIVLADELAVVLILCLPLLVSWGCFAEGGSVALLGRERWRTVFLQARFLLLLPIIPILLLSGVADAHRLMLPNGGDPVGPWFSGAACLLVVLGVPWLLRLVWPTRRLQDDDLKQLLIQPFDDIGVSIRGVFVWQTQGRVANAAVAGLVPGARYLFITDALIEHLTRAELAAIAAHEAAHLRFRHLRRLATSLAIPILTLAALNGPDLMADWKVPLLAVSVLGTWAVFHGRWARQLEHEADLGACQWLSGLDRTIIEASSLRQFAQALVATGASPDGDWLHPRPSDRVSRLAQWVAEPRQAERFQTQLKRFCWLQTLVILILVIVLVLTN